ncbi:hypothetical protein N1F78_11440 [Seonamhaeicola sp. MEBiC1930]|uniref:hypothetical protein n=1 Tax=Seonamhaeicola sp. MEBiC01930 TaxID=2976768 RepID=UPI0032451E42
MIKFFRKIRQNLLSEGKTGKYFKYAIGEIILVVIGILIALYLNNLNQQNTIQKQQENHLMLVKREMTSNINSLSAETAELTRIINATRDMLNVINSEVLLNDLTESNISTLLATNVSSDLFIQYENGALNQIIYSGGLKDIENDSIRGILASWEGKINVVRLQEEQVNNVIEKIKNLMNKSGDIRIIIEDLGLSKQFELDLSTTRGSNKNLIKLKEFENLLYELFLSGTALQEPTYSNFENEMHSLNELINQELSKK